MTQHNGPVLHLDMDAFFASVEQADKPELRGKPVAVGGKTRGVVAAASYEARAFGVHSALPVATAKRLCPGLILVQGRMKRYKELSRQIMDIVRTVSPLIEQTSVDEAYVALSEAATDFGPPLAIAMYLKQEIYAATSLTCSAGIAPNKFLAKVASDINKPDGIFILRQEEVAGFMAHLPVKKIPGIGPKTVQWLREYHVHVAGDILKRPVQFWEQRLGERGLFLYERAQGRDTSAIRPYRIPKSSSAEKTLKENTRSKALLKKYLQKQAERVAHDLSGHQQQGRTITLKIKYADFTQVTRSRTLPHLTDASEEIYTTAASLLEALPLKKDVRLIGTGVSNFEHVDVQLSLLAQ